MSKQQGAERAIISRQQARRKGAHARGGREACRQGERDRPIDQEILSVRRSFPALTLHSLHVLLIITRSMAHAALD